MTQFLSPFTPPPLLRMPTYCINDCDTRVSHKGNTCGTCMKAMKAAMKASGMENCNINIVNRPSGNRCGNDCGSRVAYKGDVCITCAEALKAAMKASGMENCNINIVNRPSGNRCGNDCGSRVAYKGDVCITCAEAQALLSGNITG